MPLPMQERSVDEDTGELVVHGRCVVLGGSGQPCEPYPCKRERLAVDEWTLLSDVMEPIAVYRRTMRWRAPKGALSPPPGARAFADRDLEMSLADLSLDAARTIMDRCAVFHETLMDVAGESDGS